MAHQTYRLSFLSLLGPLLSALVLNLLLTHSCRGHSQLIGPSRSILAGIGDDIILPCHLKPVMNINAETIEWTRPDLKERFVHVRRPGLDLVNVQNPSYKGRTSLFPHELKQGNISLKLSKVQLSDQGTYVCDIPVLNKNSSIRLVVALHTSSIPVISLSGIDRNKGGVILNCDSHSWYPEPEVFWLDGEGNLLFAGPTETVRGPDDLYTVSSRVTVENRHNNSFTCRVQQNKANLTKETLIFISEDFFEVQSSLFSITTGLSVSLAVCILVILLLGFYVWRRKKNKTKRSHRDDTDKREKNQECEVLMTESKLHEALNEKTGELQEEKQSRHEEVQRMNQEPKNKTDEVDGLKDEVNKLTEEKKRSEEERQKWEKKFKEEEKKRERVEEQVKKLQTKTGSKEETIRKERRDKEEAQSEVKTLNDQLEFKNKQLDGLKAEVNKLTEEKKRSENERQKLEQKLQDERKKSERDQRELKEEQKRNTELMKELCDLHQLHEEKKKNEDNVKKLKEHLENKKAEVKELEAAKAKQWFPSSSTKEQKKEAEKEVENLKKQLETEETELATKTKQLEKQLSEEKTKGKS